ncbi:MAG: hypothetical protein D6799_01565 [Bacteroidetes bacterium]|nr:MAG: hypothetical protein D6799_01565 [Bacteroidota bacterium]
MKTKKLFLVILSCLISEVKSQNVEADYRPVPFTQKDRDMLIELKVKTEEMEKRFNQRIDEMEKRFDQRLDEMEKKNEQRFQDMRDMIMWQGGILVTLIVALFGYIVWDRRTFMKPLERDVQQIVFKVEQLEKHNEVSQSFWSALKELSKRDEKLQEILRQYNLL